METFVESNSSVLFFSTIDGEFVKVNRYFLFLFDGFFRELLLKLPENTLDDLVITFEGHTLDELTTLKNRITSKHFECKEHHEVSDKEKPKPNIDGDTLLDSELKQKPSEIKEEVSENCKDEFNLQCPFNCDQVPESIWTPDSLYAHIYCKHYSEAKENYHISFDTFIKKLSLKISRKCALDCEVKCRDFSELKVHYYRCHVDDPAICDDCGKSFKNQKRYVDHRIKVCLNKGAECNICKDGKKHKDLNGHLLYFHSSPSVKCTEENCSRAFKKVFEMKKHKRRVHNKEKPFVCDKCGTKMNGFANLNSHRLKVHGVKFSSFKEYTSKVQSGTHDFLPANSKIPTYM